MQAMEAGGEIESLYRPIHQKEGSEIRLLDKIEEKERREDKLLDLMVLKQLLESLEAQERQLIYLRYFADKTQSEVGKMMGISQVQVSRMEKRILAGPETEGILACLASDTAGKDGCITNKIPQKPDTIPDGINCRIREARRQESDPPDAGISIRKGQVYGMEDGRKKIWICLLTVVLAAVLIGVI